MRIAAIDLGSNSFHLVVVDASADGSFAPLVREREMLRLGDVVARYGHLTEEAFERALLTMRRFRTVADGAGAEEIVACATSAIREADNSAAFVERVLHDTGIAIKVISGQDEARLVFAAVQASVLLDETAICLDLGGGSLEIAVGDHAHLHWATSVKLGVARLAAEFLAQDPPGPDELLAIDQRVRAVLEPLRSSVAAHQPTQLIGTSGTFGDLARMAIVRRTGSEPRSVNQASFTRAELGELHEELLRLPAEKRRRVPGLEARRADLIPVGSRLALTAMDVFGMDEMTVGEWALREGIILDAIGHHDPSEWAGDPRQLRRASVVDLARRCNWDESHALQVASLATQLFDRTDALHGLGSDDRELLEYGALLHDIGEHVALAAHHKHTAYLIEHGRLRGFAPDEIAALLSLGRFHRTGTPKTGFEPYGALPEARRQAVDWLIAILRVADGLDRGHVAWVTGVDVTVGEDNILIVVSAPEEPDLELWGGRRKRELLERLAGRPVLFTTRVP